MTAVELIGVLIDEVTWRASPKSGHPGEVVTGLGWGQSALVRAVQ